MLREQNIKNLKTEKEGIIILKSLLDTFIVPTTDQRKTLYEILNIDYKKYSRSVDGVVIHVDSFDKITNKRDFDLVEIKTTSSKSVKKLPYGVFFGITKNEALDIINDKIDGFNEKYGVDMQTQKEDTLSSGYTKITKRYSSMLSKLTIEKRYAVFTILCYIANSDGMTNDENIILQDILLELEIDVNKYNNSNMDGNKACDHLQDLNQQQKDEFSKFIILINIHSFSHDIERSR